MVRRRVEMWSCQRLKGDEDFVERASDRGGRAF
jgi:hypothetical protein